MYNPLIISEKMASISEFKGCAMPPLDRFFQESQFFYIDPAGTKIIFFLTKPEDEK